jgi:hypothetical protein
MTIGWFFILVTVFIGFVVWIVTRYTEFPQVDSCLDQGSRWNYEQSKCDGAQR